MPSDYSLSAQQKALIASLTGHGPMPAAFEPSRLHAAAIALSNKRTRALARAWPRLAAALGADFNERFAAYAATAALPSRGGPLADGRAFAQTLDLAHAPESVRVDILAIDLRYKMTPLGLVLRRWPAMKMLWLFDSHKLIVAIAVRGLGDHWFRVSLTDASFPWRAQGSRLLMLIGKDWISGARSLKPRKPLKSALRPGSSVDRAAPS